MGGGGRRAWLPGRGGWIRESVEGAAAPKGRKKN